MSIRQAIANKAYSLISGKKSVDLEVNTPYGNNFYTLTDGTLGKVLQALWGRYSKSTLISIFHTLPEVYAPVYQIASRVAGGNYQLKRRSNDEVIYTNKSFNRIVDSPNPLQNFQELLLEAVAYALVTGENYTYLNMPDMLDKDYRNIAAIWNLPADVVEVRKKRILKFLSATTVGDLIESYDVQIGSTSQKLAPEKVLCTRITSLYANDLKMQGASPLLAVRKNIDNLLAVYEARNVIYTKRGALGMLVSKVSDAGGNVALTPSEKKEVLEDLQNKYGLEQGKSPYAVTSYPMDWIRIAMSIDELKPFEETAADAEAIYAAYRVPRELMPNQEGSTYENQIQAQRSFYQDVIIPMAKSICTSYGTFMGLTEAGLYLDVSFDHIEALQENKKEKAAVDWQNNETYRSRFMNGICTLNEWRVAIGSEKVENPLYDKLIYDMTDTELERVTTIINLTKGANNGTNNKQAA